MSLNIRILVLAPAIVAAASCAKGVAATNDGSVHEDSGMRVEDASCRSSCGDQDGDGVPDGTDLCPDTPKGATVNAVGCADSQLTPMREKTFPPYGLTWTASGHLGRAGGLTWTYTGIQRGDLFHIYWIVCDDPNTPCGLSLDGPIDAPTEDWQFSSTDSDLAGGSLVFTNTTSIALADGTTPTLSGRLTVTVVDASGAPLAWADVGTLGVPARAGGYGVEIPGTGFTVTALAEVKDPSSGKWVPYLDYYDAAPTPAMDAGAMDAGAMDAGAMGAGPTVSFGGTFYDK